MKRLLSILSVVSLLLINIPYTHGENDVPVIITSHGVKRVIKMSQKDAHMLANKLNGLREYIKSGDMKNVNNVAYDLEKYGFNMQKFLDENKSNVACLVVATGNGMIMFTPGVILLYLAQKGFVLPIIIYFIILFATHIIPFRILNPVSYIMISNGGITTVGAGGAWNLETTENESEKIVTVVGFSGITISIPVEKGFVFMLGFAIYVQEGAIFANT